MMIFPGFRRWLRPVVTFLWLFTCISTISSLSFDDLKSWCEESEIEYNACFMVKVCVKRDMQVPNPDYCNADKLGSHLCNEDDIKDKEICADSGKKNELEAMASTKLLHDQNNAMCNNHYMTGCDICDYPVKGGKLTAGCPVMDAYTDMCKEMPQMARCREWKTLCDGNGGLRETCLSLDYGKEVTADGITLDATPDAEEEWHAPVMIMYFHTHQHIPILFKEFTPQNDGQYIGWMIAVVVFTVAGFFFRHYRSVIFKQKYLTYRPNRSTASIDAMHMIHAILRGIEFLWFYAIMLISMTYNVGIFLSLGVAAAIATYIIERWFLKGTPAKSKTKDQ